MARRYTVTFSGVAVSAAQDLVGITGATGKMIRILKCWVGVVDVTLATGQGMKLRARLMPATVTVGSGGTTGLTPSKVDQGDAACSTTTCSTNNTTGMTTNGTAVLLMTDGAHLYQGHVWQPIEPPTVPPTSGFVYELLSTTSGTVTLSGGCLIEEMG